MPLFLVNLLSSKAWRIIRPLLPYIAIGFAVLGLVLWIRGMEHTIAKQRDEIATTRADLAAEKLARERDVAGLTTLASGLAKAAVDTRADQRALQETVNAAPPTPLSRPLADLLERLRDNDAAGNGKPAAGTGGKPTPAASGSH